MNLIIVIIVAIARKGQQNHEPMKDIRANSGTGRWHGSKRESVKGSTFKLLKLNSKGTRSRARATAFSTLRDTF